MPSTVIGFIGGGNMARALIAGLCQQGHPPGQLLVHDVKSETVAALCRDFSIVSAANNGALWQSADVVVLAVKPQDALAALDGIDRQPARSPSVVFSIAAGLRVAALRAHCPAPVPVVRCMPNRPALVGAGASGLYTSGDTPERARALAQGIAAAVGSFVWVPQEKDLDVVTALSGSGPAYFVLLAELLRDAAVRQGLDTATASALATATLYGAGQLIHQNPSTTLAAERSAVTSRGGTTEAALRILQGGPLTALVDEALQAATQRSAQLGAID